MRFQAATVLACVSAAIKIEKPAGQIVTTYDPDYPAHGLAPFFKAMVKLVEAGEKIDDDNDGKISREQYISRPNILKKVKPDMTQREAKELNFDKFIDLNRDGETTPREILEAGMLEAVKLDLDAQQYEDLLQQNFGDVLCEPCQIMPERPDIRLVPDAGEYGSDGDGFEYLR